MPSSQQDIKSRLSLGRFLEERGRGRDESRSEADHIPIPPSLG